MEGRRTNSLIMQKTVGMENIVVRDLSCSSEIENKNEAKEQVEVPIDTMDKGHSKRMNTFAAKKTVAQGMMDVALITANANQLRYLIEYQRHSSTFYLIFILIVISLILQIAVGISLIYKGRNDIKGQSKSPQAEKINNYVVIGIFLITIINVFIAAFSITNPNRIPVSVENSTSRL